MSLDACYFGINPVFGCVTQGWRRAKQGDDGPLQQRWRDREIPVRRQSESGRECADRIVDRACGASTSERADRQRLRGTHAIAAPRGRPQARFRRTETGRALCPRNYGLISAALLEQLQQRIGEVEVGELLQQLGRNLGGSEVPPPPSTSGNEVALALA